MKGKQKRYLRSLAMTEQPIFQIGKGGVNDNLIIQLKDAMEARELIKIRVLNNCEYTARQLGPELAAATDSELVQIIGHNIVLYRRSTKKPMIELPE
jgi:RNA-binding protein